MPVVARNKKELSQFILDFCGYSLDCADYHRDVYAFHLHIAFRRQTVLHADQWSRLIERVLQEPLTWAESGEADPFWQDLLAFSQRIVDEVQQASADTVSLRLIKTSYLSKLDKARQSAEHAVRLLQVDGSLPADSSISAIPEGEPWSDLLRAHIAHLDLLLSLPFIVEKACLGLIHNQGVNYLPQKNAEMLAALLDTVNIATENAYVLPVKTVKIILQISMPDLPVDSPLLDLVLQELLPFLNRLLHCNQTLQACKKRVLPPDDPGCCQARQTLLASFGVHIESLQSILQDTLLIPVNQCVEAVTDLHQVYRTVNRLTACSSNEQRLIELGTLFGHFERLALLPNQIIPDLLPDWLKEANTYYLGFRQNASNFQQTLSSAAQSTWQGLGLFYTRICSFLPESLKQYFINPDPLQRLLQSIAPNPLDGKAILFAIGFFELIQQGQIEEKFQALFFQAYWNEICQGETIPLSFAAVQALHPLIPANKPLPEMLDFWLQDTYLDLPDLDQSQRKQWTILLLVHRLQVLETSGAPAVSELLLTLEQCKARQEDASLQLFANDFLKPAAGRLLNRAMQHEFIPRLEGTIDINQADSPRSIDAVRDQLPTVYSKLKAEHILTQDEFDVLIRSFQQNSKKIRAWQALAKKLMPKHPQSAFTLRLTPHQTMAGEIETLLFPPLAATLNAVLKGLNKQHRSCLNLQKLAPEGSPLHTVCTLKINYIDAINASINVLLSAVTQQARYNAFRISSLMHQDSWDISKSLLAPPDLQQVAKQLFHFSCSVVKAAVKKVDEHFFLNFLYHFLQDSSFATLYQTGITYYNTVKLHFIPQFMPTLGDPLAIANLLPSQEALLDRLIQNLLGIQPHETSLAWANRFLTRQAASVVASIDQEALASLFPFPFLGRIALRALQSKTAQQQLTTLLSSLLSPMQGVWFSQSSRLLDSAKNALYPWLGITLQQSIEQSALRYAQSPQQGQALQDERDAFAGYYLQYRALKDLNPRLPAKAFSRLLFESLKKEERAILSQAFTDLDSTLGYSNHPDQWELLFFLVQQLDFNDPDNEPIIRLVLINRYLLMSLEAAPNPMQQRQAIDTLSAILDKMGPAIDSDDDDDHPEPNAPERDLIAIVKPAADLTNRLFLNQLKTALQNAKQAAKAISTNNDIRQRDHQQEPQLGQSVLQVEWNKSKNNLPRLFYQLARGLFQLSSFVSLWAAIVLPIVYSAGYATFMQSFFTVLGIGSAVGAAATIPGAIALGSFFLLRFIVNFVKEILKNRPEFKAIKSSTTFSPLQKWGKMAWLGCKCFALALVNAAFTDFLVKKIKRYLPLNLAGNIQQAMQVYPTHDELEQEKEQLEQVETTLQTIEDLLAGFNGSTYATIVGQLKDIQTLLQGVNEHFQNSTDARQQDTGHQSRLDACREAFSHLSSVLQQVMTMHQITEKINQPIALSIAASSTAPSLIIPLHATPAQAPHQPIVLHQQLTSYFAKALPEKSADPNTSLASTGYIPWLISGFYQALSYAERLLSWRWNDPTTAAPCSASTSMMIGALSTGKARLVNVTDDSLQTEIRQAANHFFEDSLGSFIYIPDETEQAAPATSEPEKNFQHG